MPTIDLARETSIDEFGPARRFLPRPLDRRIVVPADRAAFERLGARYLRFR